LVSWKANRLFADRFNALDWCKCTWAGLVEILIYISINIFHYLPKYSGRLSQFTGAGLNMLVDKGTNNSDATAGI